MKWDEIPKFKEFGIPNPINMGFVRYVEFLKDEIENYGLQMNPNFQRGHVWTEEQQIAYVEFFLRGCKSGRDFYFNWNKLTDENDGIKEICGWRNKSIRPVFQRIQFYWKRGWWTAFTGIFC